MVNVEYLRRFAGADPGEDDAVLKDMLDAAVDWYEKAAPDHAGRVL